MMSTRRRRPLVWDVNSACVFPKTTEDTPMLQPKVAAIALSNEHMTYEQDYQRTWPSS
jgi:hypothetical protein